jgi:hypothetical protein
MKKFASLSFLLFSCYFLAAQSLVGNYKANGGLSLELERSIGGVQGYLKDGEGNSFLIQAEEDHSGTAFGTLSTDQGAMFVRAVRSGAQLYLTLYPVGANGQADPGGAQEYILTALDENGNPLSALPNNVPQAYEQARRAPQSYSRTAEPPSENWNGFFSGRVMDEPSTLSLQLNGSQLSGLMDVNGYRYSVEGSGAGFQTRGKLIDLQSRSFFNFTANLDGKQINLNLENPVNGTSQLVVFKRGTGTVLNPNPPFNARPYDEVTFKGPEQRDSEIVGHWYYGESFKAGDYISDKRWKFILNPDGTYIFGDARVIGNGPAGGGRGYGGDINTGRWRTEDHIIYVDKGTGWEAYAYYVTTGPNLLLEFGNNVRQLWQRTN